jgi:hypothetical protein
MRQMNTSFDIAKWNSLEDKDHLRNNMDGVAFIRHEE